MVSIPGVAGGYPLRTAPVLEANVALSYWDRIWREEDADRLDPRAISERRTDFAASTQIRQEPDPDGRTLRRLIFGRPIPVEYTVRPHTMSWRNALWSGYYSEIAVHRSKDPGRRLPLDRCTIVQVYYPYSFDYEAYATLRQSWADGIDELERRKRDFAARGGTANEFVLDAAKDPLTQSRDRWTARFPDPIRDPESIFLGHSPDSKLARDTEMHLAQATGTCLSEGKSVPAARKEFPWVCFGILPRPDDTPARRKLTAREKASADVDAAVQTLSEDPILLEVCPVPDENTVAYFYDIRRRHRRWVPPARPLVEEAMRQSEVVLRSVLRKSLAGSPFDPTSWTGRYVAYWARELYFYELHRMNEKCIGKAAVGKKHKGRSVTNFEAQGDEPSAFEGSFRVDSIVPVVENPPDSIASEEDEDARERRAMEDYIRELHAGLMSNELQFRERVDRLLEEAKALILDAVNVDDSQRLIACLQLAACAPLLPPQSNDLLVALHALRQREGSIGIAALLAWTAVNRARM
jgi:hypothetical protein